MTRLKQPWMFKRIPQILPLAAQISIPDHEMARLKQPWIFKRIPQILPLASRDRRSPAQPGQPIKPSPAQTRRQPRPATRWDVAGAMAWDLGWVGILTIASDCNYRPGGLAMTLNICGPLKPY